MNYTITRHIYLVELSKRLVDQTDRIFIDNKYDKTKLNLICSDQEAAANAVVPRFEFIDYLNETNQPRSSSEPLIAAYVKDDEMDIIWQMMSPKTILILMKRKFYNRHGLARWLF